MTSDLDFYRIIWARPFRPGFYGLRYATEHPADGSPSGPANPSRIYLNAIILYCKINLSQL